MSAQHKFGQVVAECFLILILVVVVGIGILIIVEPEPGSTYCQVIAVCDSHTR